MTEHVIVVGAPLPSPVADARLLDAKDEETTLAAVTRGKTTLVLFVRQFACAGCGEQVAALLPHLAALRMMDVSVVILGCGTKEQAQWFDERLGITERGVRLLTDPTLTAQRAAGLPRTWLSVYGPRAVVGLVRAILHGHENGWSGGDFYQQGGALLVDRGARVVYFRRQRWLGDLVDIGDITDVVLVTRARERFGDTTEPVSP